MFLWIETIAYTQNTKHLECERIAEQFYFIDYVLLFSMWFFVSSSFYSKSKLLWMCKIADVSCIKIISFLVFLLTCYHSRCFIFIFGPFVFTLFCIVCIICWHRKTPKIVPHEMKTETFLDHKNVNKNNTTNQTHRKKSIYFKLCDVRTTTCRSTHKDLSFGVFFLPPHTLKLITGWEKKTEEK